MRRAAKEQMPERMAELQAFETTHAEVGAYLLWLWALPDSITEIVLRHHEFPSQLAAARTPAAVVYLADALVKGGVEEERAIDHLIAMGLGDKVDGWKQTFQDRNSGRSTC